MAVAVEQLGRRGRLGGGRTGRRLKYRATGAVSIAEAEGAVLAQIIADYGSLFLDGVPLANLSADESNVDNHYIVEAEFDPLPPLAPQTQSDPSRFSFDFGQDSIRATTSFGTRRYGAGPNNGNLINVQVNPDGTRRVDGVDVPSPAFTFGKTTIEPIEAVNDLFVFQLGQLHLHVNASTFSGFPAREVLFMGASGSQRSPTEVEITLRFGRRRNLINQTIGGIAGVTKYGWEYLEPLYSPATLSASGEQLQADLTGFVAHELFPIAGFSFLDI
jgi:hypothetical protein